MPLGILLNVCLSLFGVLTAWIWVPISLVVRYIINILVVDTENVYNNVLPLFCELFGGLLIKGIGQLIVFSIYNYIYIPVVSLGLVAFAYIRKFVRTVYDSIIFNIVIKPLARIPINDSIFAYKVKGVGIGRKCFM